MDNDCTKRKFTGVRFQVKVRLTKIQLGILVSQPGNYSRTVTEMSITTTSVQGSTSISIPSDLTSSCLRCSTWRSSAKPKGGRERERGGRVPWLRLLHVSWSEFLWKSRHLCYLWPWQIAHAPARIRRIRRPWPTMFVRGPVLNRALRH